MRNTPRTFKSACFALALAPSLVMAQATSNYTLPTKGVASIHGTITGILLSRMSGSAKSVTAIFVRTDRSSTLVIDPGSTGPAARVAARAKVGDLISADGPIETKGDGQTLYAQTIGLEPQARRQTSPGNLHTNGNLTNLEAYLLSAFSGNAFVPDALYGMNLSDGIGNQRYVNQANMINWIGLAPGLGVFVGPTFTDIMPPLPVNPPAATPPAPAPPTTVSP